MNENSRLERIYLTRKDLYDMGIDISNGHLLRLETDDLFPRRRYISKQKVVWLKSEIYEHIEKINRRAYV